MTNLQMFKQVTNPQKGAPLVIAHRGGAGVWPENTLFAFRQAAALGVDGVELDVHASKDGHVVVIHDEILDRTTNGTGLVREKTLAELHEMDAGWHWRAEDGTYPYRGKGIGVSSLGEVLKALPTMRFVIEVKQTNPVMAAPLAEILRGCGAADRVIVAAFDAATLPAFRQICPEAATSCSEREVRRFYARNLLRLPWLARNAAQALQVPEMYGARHVVSERFVRSAHARGMDVHVWTVNEEEQMRRLAGWDVDALISDRPDRALRLFGRKSAEETQTGATEGGTGD